MPARPIPTLTIARPDDWHLHLRDGRVLAQVLPETARRFARAIVMPNLNPPVLTTGDAAAYRSRILAALPAGFKFEPLMTLYLTDHTTAGEIDRARASGFIHALKYYPAGATTNSDRGVTAIEKCAAALDRMQDVGMPLLMHGEVTDDDVDIFDRERVFVDRVLAPLAQRFPALRIVLEHVTTEEAVQYVSAAGPQIAATLTAHHLLMNRNAMLAGGIRPHNYCLPVLKREGHRRALVRAATSGNPKFFLGTDSAPHPRSAKESARGCAGCYSAPAAIELYAEAFEAAGALDRLEGFASFFGADFYGLPRNAETITMVREDWRLPERIGEGEEALVPFRAGERLRWRVSGE
ncbi:MAG: dihydroorotase [Rhodocyclaceae bacterium]